MATKDGTDQQKEIATLKNFAEDLSDHISEEVPYQILHKKEDIQGLVEKGNMKDMDDSLTSLREDTYFHTETTVKVTVEKTDRVVFLKGFKELMERAKESHLGVEDYIDDEEDENSIEEDENCYEDEHCYEDDGINDEDYY